jgi:lipoprotein-anchoring transpeptidase ErfK/SrfK
VTAAAAVTSIIALVGARGDPGEPPSDTERTPSSASAEAAPSSSPDALTTPAPAVPAGDALDAPAETLVAAARSSRVPVSAAPGGPTTGELDDPRPSGAPLVLRVLERQGDWIRVPLAQRPNGSTGWVPVSAVSLSTTDYAIVVTLASSTLDLYRAGRIVHSYPVATGTAGTPTPVGRFAITELLAPTNAGYGPYAFGTTAFSDAISSFGGGPGQIGLHGTDDVSSLGRAASHGCIRMHDADITALAKILPLGTPFQVR